MIDLCQQVIDDDIGFTMVRNEILYSGLSPYQIRVYIHLKSRAWGNSGRCWDSKNAMARITGMDERILKRTLVELIEFGLIIEVDPPDSIANDPEVGGRQMAYRLLRPSSWKLPENLVLNFEGQYRKPRKNADSDGGGGCINAPGGGCINAPGSTILVLKEKQMKKISLKGSDGAKTPRTPRSPKARSLGSQVWEEYRTGMIDRWKTDPPRNVKTASQCIKLIELVGFDNAMALAKAYPNRLDKWYTEKGHPFGLLLTDYPKILRDISLGFKITNHMAKKMESAFDGVQAMTLSDQGIFPCAISAYAEDQHAALPPNDESLF